MLALAGRRPDNATSSSSGKGKMVMSIASWSARLKDHFERLHQQRLLSTTNLPIFGLEHGLSCEEVGALQADIREYASRHAPSSTDALPWVVYATEIGYRYEGYEYWQTFEEQTPGWEYRGDRYWLRNCFLGFSRRYGGAVPSGVWADHFSIICWPITHAILPLDLQRHLAKILYELRHEFSKEMLDDPSILGDMVRSRAWTANSRFRDFAQNSALIGQIAAALLLQGQEGSNSLINPAALERIRRDLEGVRHVRGWLRDASRYAQRIHLAGLSRGGRRPTSDLATTVAHARRQLEEAAVDPRLMLQPTDEGSWRVLLEIPDLSQLLVRFPQLRPVLTESRCRVAGSSGRVRARGWTLYGSQLVPLDEWPSSGEVLLRFERSMSQLDFLLSTECLLRPGQIFLFKIASDNLAHHVRSLSLRLGNSYIIVNTSGPFQQTRWVMPVVLACRRAYAAMLQMPDVLSPQLEQLISELGLQVAKSISIWPAGLTAARWDGEGSAEWLSTENPCIGMRIDHEARDVTVLLDEDLKNRLQIIPEAMGKPVFIGLPELTIGTHTVTVSVRYTSVDSKEERGSLKITVRDPQTWRPGIGAKSALSATVEPRNPTLAQLWENRVGLQILGPEQRKISCRIDLFDKDSAEPVFTDTLPDLELPVDTAAWRSYFDRNVRRVQSLSNAYDGAHSCKIVFDAGEIGSFTLESERELRPLRWLVRYDGTSGRSIRLIDDTGALSKPTLCRYAFDKPDRAVPQQADAFQKDFVAAADGLYYAESEQCGYGIILPPQAKPSGSQTGLWAPPEISQRIRSPDGAADVLRHIELWSNAHLTGDLLCEIGQLQAVEALTRYLFSLIGGKKWGDIEEAIGNSTTVPDMEFMLSGLSGKAEHEQLQRQLSAMTKDFALLPTEDRIERLTALCTPFVRIILQLPKEQPSRDLCWLSELALRLASHPEGVSVWAGGYRRWGLDHLLQQPILARSARFLVLYMNRQKAIYGADDSFFDWDWRWQ